MERHSKAEARALDAQCDKPTSTPSRIAVVKLRAMSPDDKVRCLLNYAEADLANLIRCALAAGVSADTCWGEIETPVLCLSQLRRAARARSRRCWWAVRT